MTEKENKGATPLDGLAAAIAADPALKTDGQGNEDAPEQDAAEPQLSNAQLFAVGVEIGAQLFTVITKIKAPQNVLSHERCAQLGELWGPVLDKYGINAGQFMGAWQLEIAAVMGTVGVVLELRSAVRAEIAQRQAEQQKEAEPQGVTGSAIPA